MKRRLRVFVVGGFFLLAIVLPASITFYTDWLWFGEMGYQAVFARSLAAQGRTQDAGLRGRAGARSIGFLRTCPNHARLATARRIDH